MRMVSFAGLMRLTNHSGGLNEIESPRPDERPSQRLVGVVTAATTNIWSRQLLGGFRGKIEKLVTRKWGDESGPARTLGGRGEMGRWRLVAGFVTFVIAVLYRAIHGG